MSKRSFTCLSSMILLSALITGCDEPKKSSANTSPEGVSLRVRADLPLNSQQASIAASAYLGGALRLLVGGDIFYARNTTNERELRYIPDIPGLYQNTLDTNDTGTKVTVDIRFRPETARNQRWYPSDLLKVESSASRLVGYSASGLFPPAIRVNEPQMQTIYRSRTDEAIISWDTVGTEYQAEIMTVAECHSGTHSSSFTKRFNTADDGNFTLVLEQSLPKDVNVEKATQPGGVFFPLYRELGIALLDIMTFGLFKLKTITTQSYPIEYCNLELKLFRTQAGQLGAGVRGGSITMSRSDSVNVRYEP